MEIRGNSLPFRDRPHLLGVVRDISEEAATYRLLEARVQDRTRELSGLLSVSGRLAGVVDVADIPGVLVEEAEEVVTRSSFEGMAAERRPVGDDRSAGAGHGLG